MARCTVIILVLVLFLTQFAQAQTPNANDAALTEISAAAANICTSIPFDGNSGGGSLSASADAKLGGLLGKLLSKLSDIGIKGSAGFSDQRFRNVLQKDLLQAIQNSDNCRKDVLNTLKYTLLTKPSDSGNSVGSVTATGPNSVAVGVNSGPISIGAAPASSAR